MIRVQISLDKGSTCDENNPIQSNPIAKLLAIVTLALPLLACGGSSTKDYTGYWQMNNEKRVVILQIKQDGSNHLLTLDILSERHANKPYALTQKDGKLAVSTGFGEAVLTLSDDGNTLYLDNKNYHKIDEGTKDKLVTLQENCKALSEQFSKEWGEIKLFTDGFEQKQDAVIQTYLQKFNDLEKDGICNSKPGGISMKQSKS